MMKSYRLVFIFLFSFVSIAFSPNIVKAEETVFIKSDGRVEGTNLLQRNNNTYTFLNDISGNIEVSKDFITIDGSGYTLKGSGDSSQTAINLSHIKNVTIKNIVINNFGFGISCKSGVGNTANITIWSNYILNCDIGVEFLGSSNNTIKYNTFKNNSIDIAINYVLGNNIITHNTIDSYIQVWMSDQPTIDMNYWTEYNGTDKDGDGIGDSPYYYHDILQDSHPLIDPVPVIREFPPCIILPLFLSVTLAALLIKKKIINTLS